jgi:glycerol uptake facilitator-like aquaporin
MKQLDQYAAFAEFLGSFLFMFFGGACVANRWVFSHVCADMLALKRDFVSVDHGLGVSALGNGFAYTALVFALAAISGGHMNPGDDQCFE